MPKMYLSLEIDLTKGAEPEKAAEALFDYVCNIDEPTIFSINGYDYNLEKDQ
jgi:hypothetical protein